MLISGPQYKSGFITNKLNVFVVLLNGYVHCNNQPSKSLEAVFSEVAVTSLTMESNSSGLRYIRSIKMALQLSLLYLYGWPTS